MFNLPASWVYTVSSRQASQESARKEAKSDALGIVTSSPGGPRIDRRGPFFVSNGWGPIAGTPALTVLDEPVHSKKDQDQQHE